MDISVKKAFDFDYVALMKHTWRYMHRTSIDRENTRVAASFADGASNGLLSPACVASCKYDALVFGDINDPYSYISRLLKVKDTVRIRPELGTEPSLRYIPVVKKGV